MTRIAGMDAPAAMVGQTVADELAVHGWDVARALGQPYTADPDVLTAARAFLDQFASPDAPRPGRGVRALPAGGRAPRPSIRSSPWPAATWPGPRPSAKTLPVSRGNRYSVSFRAVGGGWPASATTGGPSR